ncbi:MAG: hypothetical protein BAJALOKI3v1_200001 [Promethearchaeota archaeon]|nr:MAG: hypothetical protein BAJALOKI3v1_200001 [Candidatus Lokiarchaeota archaeon]
MVYMDGKKQLVFTLKYYRALGQSSGNQFIGFLQELHDKIVTVDVHQEHFQGIVLRDGSFKDKVGYKERIKVRYPGFSCNNFEKLQFYLNNAEDATERERMSILITQLSALNHYMFQWDRYSLRAKREGLDISPVIPSETLLNLFSEPNEYSKDSHIEKVSILAPRDGDPMYETSSVIYHEQNPQLDSEHDLYWENTINRISVDEDGHLKLNLEDMENTARIKMFYSSWLVLMQNAILKPGNVGFLANHENTLFKDGDRDKPLTFSEGEEFNEEDFKIITQLTDIMVKIFGYPTFALMSLGLVSFRRDTTSEEMNIEFLSIPVKDFATLLSEFSIKHIFSYGDPGDFSSEQNIKIIFRKILLGCLSMGLFLDLKIDGSFRRLKIAAPTSQGFLFNYFERFMPQHLKDYGKALDGILRNEYEPYMSYIESSFDTLHTDAREKVYEELAPKLETEIQDFFKIKNVRKVKAGDETSAALNIFKKEILTIDINNGLNDEQIVYFLKWRRWTISNARDALKQYLVAPTDYYDYLKDMREVWEKGEGINLDIKGKRESNPFLASGFITLKLSHEDLDNLFNPLKHFNIYISSIFSAYSSVENKMVPRGYYQSFDRLWNSIPKFEEKLSSLYEELYEVLFKDGSSEEFSVKFFKTKGGGIDKNYKLYKSYKNLDFTEFAFNFKRSEPNEVHSAVQSIIFYSLFCPRVISLVYDGKKTFTKADLFLATDLTETYDAKFLREYSALNNNLEPKASKVKFDLIDLKNTLLNQDELPMFLYCNPPNPDNLGELEINNRDAVTQQKMLQYCAFKFMKFLVEGGYELKIEDLTANQYITLNNLYITPGGKVYEKLRENLR